MKFKPPIKQRFTWATLIVGAALMSACGAPDAITVGNGTTSPAVTSTAAPVVPTATPFVPTVTPAPATQLPQSSELSTLKPTDILLQFEYEPTFTMPEYTQPFGRSAQFTLFADGSIFYIDEDQAAEMPQPHLMRAQLTPEQTIALLHQYRDMGLANVEPYTDMCAPGQGEQRSCIADAAYTVTRIRLSNGELHESRNYAGFAANGDVLKTATEQLQKYTNPQASEYQPEHATLFVTPVKDRPDGVTILAWPLSADWLAAPRAALDQWAKVVEGSDLATLLKAVPHNNGVYWFQSGEQYYRTSLVPWLPGNDYREAVGAYQMPPAQQNTPIVPTSEVNPTPSQ